MIDRILHGPIPFWFPQIVKQASWGLEVLLALFQTSCFSGIEIYVKQWSRIPCSRKTILLAEHYLSLALTILDHIQGSQQGMAVDYEQKFLYRFYLHITQEIGLASATYR